MVWMLFLVTVSLIVGMCVGGITFCLKSVMASREDLERVIAWALIAGFVTFYVFLTMLIYMGG